ncbi:hypothetical protein MPTK1_8g10510 [Marchantia polymorpha subsp. ruderalis]|uniref:SAGA-associated factor 11 n=2 Tax=Marchantia polymorpha TaxID=3197 RepID=A0A176WRX3_MARPO|nr:hypothetical protein AXG93_4346s1240 [Marchantia polymorpha subsp. ruderalis]PTQ47419.1 hypothetical protein MARPO_0008s0171 [Marchantia polymorpha]BBN19413.1 hypothetical protein Mp_8g10510 [Marchantia polymorpha subsp. ruderalis]|eukprot:PTQ47419.1 hypothetical protein MARPO_0008s0171 [Marchantia polymorpha]
MLHRSQAERDEDHGDGGDGEREIEELALERAALDALKDEQMEADELNLLEDEDMLIFGLNPLTDILKLVSCNVCKKPVIDSQFTPHFQRCVASRRLGPLHIGVGQEKGISELEEGPRTSKIERRKRSQNRHSARRFPTISEEMEKMKSDKDLSASAPKQQNELSSSFRVDLHGNEKATVERKLRVSEDEVFKPKVKDRTERDFLPTIKEVSEGNGSHRRQKSEDESIAGSTSKRISSQEYLLAGEEAHRPDFRIRRRDVADICSDIRSQLRPPLTVVTRGGQNRAAEGPESHPHSPRTSTRKKYVNLQKTEVDGVQSTNPPTMSTTSGKRKSKRGRQVPGIMNLLRKKGITADDKRGGKIFRTQGKVDIRRNAGDARALRRAKRQKMKDQLILESSKEFESSSEIKTYTKTSSLVKSTQVKSLRHGADHGLSKPSIHEHGMKGNNIGAAKDEGDLRHAPREKKKRR